MSWIEVETDTDFTIYNLPFGVFSYSGTSTSNSNNINKNPTTSNNNNNTNSNNNDEGKLDAPTTSTTFNTNGNNKPQQLDVVDPTKNKRCCTIVGTTIIDLSILEEAGLFYHNGTIDRTDSSSSTSNINFNNSKQLYFMNQTTLNQFISQPKSVWTYIRHCLIRLLITNPPDRRLIDNVSLQHACFYNTYHCTMHLPISIGHYTDFYASKEHATNVGTMFRGKENALQPNWLHLPVGYHGRASTIYNSPSYVQRPYGQIQIDSSNPKVGSTHSPTKKLDFELEIGTIIGGSPVSAIPSIQQAKDCIFGYVLLNDWSARDIQQFEYVPLGPFTSKNFHTTISSWIVTTNALEGDGFVLDENTNEYLYCDSTTQAAALSDSTYTFVSSTSAIVQDNPIPLPYLHDPDNYTSYDVTLTVSIRPGPPIPALVEKASSSSSSANLEQEQEQEQEQQEQQEQQQQQEPQPETLVCTTNMKHLYWTTAQQIVHHCVTGCILQSCDILGTGTISGTKSNSFGSMLELTMNGTKPISIKQQQFVEGVTSSNTGGYSSSSVNNKVAVTITATTRSFLEDGDTVIMKGYCCTTTTNDDDDNNTSRPPVRIGFGECIGTIVPAVLPAAGNVVTTKNNNHSSTSSSDNEKEQYTNFVLYWNDEQDKEEATMIMMIEQTVIRIGLAVKHLPYTIRQRPKVERHMNTAKNNDKDDDDTIAVVPFTLLECICCDTGTTVQLYDSYSILQFLDDMYPHRYQLIPNSTLNPIKKAYAIQIVQMIRISMNVYHNAAVLKNRRTQQQYEQERHKEEHEKANDDNDAGKQVETFLSPVQRMMNESLKQIEHHVCMIRGESNSTNSSNIGPYCLGTFAPTIVDVYIASTVFHLVDMIKNQNNVVVIVDDNNDTDDLQVTCPTIVDIANHCQNEQHSWFMNYR